MTNSVRRRRSARRGSILVLSAILIAVVCGILAFSVDLGMAYVDRTEMQRAADAAAIAAVNELLDQQLVNPTKKQSETAAVEAATRFASLNSVGSISPRVAAGDIEIGFLADRNQPSGPIISGYGQLSNAARVRIKRTAEINGETRLFFAPVLGHRSVAQEVEATAAFVSSFRGFTVRPDGKNLDILPIALDLQTWEDLQHKLTSDDWTWDASRKTVIPGPDGIFEVNLFPQDTGMPGNRGTVDIGQAGNSTADLKRQITEGVSAEDLSYHGGSIEFDSNGELVLNGDPGISAGIKSQLSAIKGEPRIIPVFEHAAGNGNNAYYTITKFVGVRVMEVDFSGSSSGSSGKGKGKAGQSGATSSASAGKRLIVQPATVRIRGGIPSDDSSSDPSTHYIYSSATLVN